MVCGCGVSCGIAGLRARGYSGGGGVQAPMYLLSNSGPLTLMRPSPQRAGSAPAISVLPHPAGPYNITPDLTLPVQGVRPWGSWIWDLGFASLDLGSL